MITITLCGELGDLFTNQITVAVGSVAEAIAALRANFKGFANYLFEAAQRGVNYTIQVGYEDIEEKQLNCPISKKVRSIRITPIIAGSGAALRIIGGVALLGLGLTGVGLLGLSPLTLALTGGALLFSGISALFNRQDTSKSPELFSAPSNNTQEGGRVPVVYGVALVGIYIVSADIRSSYVQN